MNILNISKNIGIKHNVIFRTIDINTRKICQQVEGHNAATNSMLNGIAHYLVGDGVLSQGIYMLSNYIPKYISLGTMGLINQDEDANGLPNGIGVSEGDEEIRFTDYMNQCPGYGADGYDENANNGRKYLGLGPTFADRESTYTINCELISNTFPRQDISYREIIPETQSELPKTIDVIFSAMISTGALAQFREPDKDYIFITEAGLWSKPAYQTGGDNGLLAGYRIVPPNETNWDMTNPDNREILKKNILRVGINQVVQVIWKIQLGAIEQLYPDIQ